jgi:hypothetical protein
MEQPLTAIPPAAAFDHTADHADCDAADTVHTAYTDVNNEAAAG